MSTVSLRPGDAGFDAKDPDTIVDISDPEIDHVLYLDLDGNPAEVWGSKLRIAGILADAGYNLIVERTPNGRQIRYEDGRYIVRPDVDWVELDLNE